ncbi:MerR family transcriptional regulator [Variovorax sp. J2P1-59]|uniref:MerR family transcriptional regulator n=1 Tax=Variovorax flavidus TaxID=3053501 RepID=UPI00257645A8|nr:MerR family transcriptional regulator [Variovorax sp. J2P1-59]MDM0078557.1 MerR family transcriptional regulator [Variovorax sp. J2P1-59]
MFLDIAEVARSSGLTASALRYYERRRLIRSSGRNGLRRTYEPDVLARLALINCARAAGFTLAQIGRFLVATPGDVELRKQMGQRARELDAQIAQLIRMRNSLRHAAICRHEPLVECPKFKAFIDEPKP